MKRLFRFVIFVPLAALLIIFAVANRDLVLISFDPISPNAPIFALEMPIYVLVFAVLIIGVLIGGTASWLAQGKWRKQARQNKVEAARWRYRAETASAANADDVSNALPAPR